jgi:dihydroorotase-like cyclic amidohydrolase
MTLHRLPGLIDVHVHLRDPGATHKEDFSTGARAAIVGGFTTILDMPNNATPTFTLERLEEKIDEAKRVGICDIGFHFGTNGHNLEEFPKIWDNPHVYGLKIYCNHTTGDLLIEDLALLEQVFAAWNSDKPILVHAEGMQLAGAITLAHFYDRCLHVCHISQKIEVELVRQAKKKKLKITAGVTPHHLFMTVDDVATLGSHAIMKPPLGTTKDKEALWAGIADQTIDIVETDHAPHTIEEKQSEKPPYGVPGLETALGLLLVAVHDKKITLKDVERLLYTAPKKIFAIHDQGETFIEFDPTASYVIGEGGYQSKCGWSPFEGWTAYGKVVKVVSRGKTILDKGKLLQ